MRVTQLKHINYISIGNNINVFIDVNGAYQIMKKVFSNAFADGIVGVGLVTGVLLLKI